MDTFGDLLEECRSQLLIRREVLQVDWDEDLLRLCVDITNIDTTLVCEEDPVALMLN